MTVKVHVRILKSNKTADTFVHGGHKLKSKVSYVELSCSLLLRVSLVDIYS